MADIRSPRLIYLKGCLFLGTGILAATLLVCLTRSVPVALLLGIAIWSFSRFYYFAFYVIEHYVDGDFRFAGLLDFTAYAWKQRFGWRGKTRIRESPREGPTRRNQ